jgi:hypothetical protein
VVAIDNRDTSANATLFFEKAGNGKFRAVSSAQLGSNRLSTVACSFYSLMAISSFLN